MPTRSILTALFAVLALALPAVASAAPNSGAVVFSRVTQHTETKKIEVKEGETPKSETKTIVEGGLFAVRDGNLNQLTEDPTDTEPAFSPDGTSIAFVRGAHLFSVRADGSGLRQLTSGPGLASRPVVSPDGRLVVFEHRAATGASADLYVVRSHGGGLHVLASSPYDDHEALIATQPRTGYELAQKIWGNVAVTQAFLTLSEVIGHADLLVNEGRVRELHDGEVIRYEATG